MAGCSSGTGDSQGVSSTEGPEAAGTGVPETAETALPSEEPADYTDRIIMLSEEYEKVKIDGRYTVIKNGITCDWTASGIEFRADCRGDVVLTVKGAGGESASAYFTVFVDGQRQKTRAKAATSGTTELTIAKGLAVGLHEFRIFKQTYVKMARLNLYSLAICGELRERPADRKLYLEFIGDSITAGHGALGGGGSAEYMDGTGTFAFKTAEALGSDFSMICVDGIGVVKGYQTEHMIDIYGLTDKYRSARTVYAAERIPDAVIINLGTNDATFSVGRDDFKAGVKELIEAVRSLYGDSVTVVWVYNSMRADNGDFAVEAVSELGGSANGLYTLKLERDSSGGNGHPSDAGHTKNAQILTEFLKGIVTVA